jgi:hypothetical protein
LPYLLVLVDHHLDLDLVVAVEVDNTFGKVAGSYTDCHHHHHHPVHMVHTVVVVVAHKDYVLPSWRRDYILEEHTAFVVVGCRDLEDHVSVFGSMDTLLLLVVVAVVVLPVAR